VSDADSPEALTDLVERYNDAWNRQDVDAIDSETLERALAGLAQVLGAPIGRPLARAGARQPTLGGDRQVVGIGVQRLGDQLLAHVGPVGVGGVNQVDAQLDRAAQGGDRAVTVLGRPPDPVAGYPHRPEAEAANSQLPAEGQRSSGLVGQFDRLWCHGPLLPLLPSLQHSQAAALARGIALAP